MCKLIELTNTCAATFCQAVRLSLKLLGEAVLFFSWGDLWVSEYNTDGVTDGTSPLQNPEFFGFPNSMLATPPGPHAPASGAYGPPRAIDVENLADSSRSLHIFVAVSSGKMCKLRLSLKLPDEVIL